MIGVDDEVLDLDRRADADGREDADRRGGAAGRADAGRTGRMRDIVETIQAEQDRVIRADLPRRAGRAGRPGHRQDRGRAAPGGVPALHPPASSSTRRAC